MWRLCHDATEIRQREAVEIWQREAIENRQREAIEIRQSIGCGRADHGQGGDGDQDRRRAARSRLLHRFRLSLRFLVRCFGHLRSSTISPVAKISPRRRSAKQERAVAWAIPATTRARLPRQIPLKSWAYMVNDRLFSGGPGVADIQNSAPGRPEQGTPKKIQPCDRTAVHR